MKQVIVVANCDACLDNDLKIASDHSVIVSFGLAPKEFDLCDEHYIDLVAPLITLLGKYGVEPGRIPKKMRAPSAKPSAKEPPVRQLTQLEAEEPLERDADGNLRCPSCGRYFKRENLITHIGTTEGVHLDRPKKCADCGFEENYGPAMSAHRRKMHGYDALEYALAELRKKMGVSVGDQIPLAG